jgi:hypothetical protein
MHDLFVFVRAFEVSGEPVRLSLNQFVDIVTDADVGKAGAAKCDGRFVFGKYLAETYKDKNG